ncbi:MAG TPA: HAMP domain-containing sensor histidine kinase, partial [Cytophagaceae bacterium]|nr:HAMP domain-containing sensor histidine kinase [Cytophagaceae bacterium]
LGLAQLIDSEDNKLQIHKYVGLMEKSIQKLDTFILDLTNFSRNSRLDVVIEEIDFNRLIDEALDNLQFMDKASKVKIIREFDHKLSFYSDQIRLSVILQNLLSNAFKYADKDKAESFLRIRIVKEGAMLLMEFEDNGIGIIDAYIEKLFSMFFRASQDSYGSGLGLYITKQVVEKLGGTISVRSMYQQGTSFFVKLPYVSGRNLQ